MVAKSRRRIVRGEGIVNTLIDKLPFEAHLPGYSYCGPGTRLQRRLLRNEKGINPLDEACKAHDISYSQSSDIQDRHRADRALAEAAWSRVIAPDASLGERAASLLVTNIMKGKLHIGAGMNLKQLSMLRAALKRSTTRVRRKPTKKRARRVKVPKKGGILPLLPLLAGLSAIGGLAGGAAKIAQAVNAKKAETHQLEEAMRHNKAVEDRLVDKGGKGLYLHPYRKGKGLYLKKKP